MNIRHITDFDLARKYVSKKFDAEKRNIKFSMGLASLRNIMQARKCFYTGMRLDEKTFSIDRIDSTKGYEVGNVVACHSTFNKIKGALENDECNKGVNIRMATKAFLKLSKIYTPKLTRSEEFDKRYNKNLDKIQFKKED